MSDNTSVALKAVQTAAYSTLSGHLTGSLYDEVPKTAVFPYTTFGDMSEAELEARGVKGRICYIQLRVHSRDQGGKFQVYTIMAEIVEHLTAAKLSITGWKEIWKTYRAGTVVAVEKDPGAYLGVVQFLIAVCKST